MAHIGTVILAAGAGTRLGVAKALLRWGADTFLSRALRHYGDYTPVVVVAGAQLDQVRERVTAGAELVFNPVHRGPMIRSVQIGLRQLADRVQAAFIAPVDQPLLDASVIRQLAQAFEQHAAPCTLPVYQGNDGHPLLLNADQFAAVDTLAEHQTLQQYVTGLGGLVQRVSVDCPEAVMNINTPEEYRAFMTRVLPA